ncbi:MAG: hypothetical protein B6244_02085 [Candidatus Cloacimonetes bacterium 4572_55]|nr:MAG: hypothetical protein B6244_02085 [Candidatus Cloacimonetes bacterium 4572_55]
MGDFERRNCEIETRVSYISFSEKARFSTINHAIRDSINQKHYHLIVDCASIVELDYPELGELIGLNGKLKKLSGNMILFNLDEGVDRQLKVVGLSNVLTIAVSEKEALEKFQRLLNQESESMSIQFPSVMDYVPGIRYLISHTALLRGFDKKDAYRIETIVDELCNNAIEHGSADVNQENIRVKCVIDSTKLDLTIIDGGHIDTAIDSENILDKLRAALISTADPGDMRGRGLPIVSMLADKVDFFIEEGRVAVHVEKRKSH